MLGYPIVNVTTEVNANATTEVYANATTVVHVGAGRGGEGRGGGPQTKEEVEYTGMYGNGTYTYENVTGAQEMLWILLVICMIRFTSEMYVVCRNVIGNMSRAYRTDRIKSIRLTASHLDTLNECAICLDDFEIGDRANILKCSHGFHEICLKEWLPLNFSCPVCRQPIGVRSTDNLRSRITDEENH